MNNILAVLLLPIVFPISVAVWVLKSIFGPKTVAVTVLQREQLLHDSEWLRSLAEKCPEAHTKGQLEEAALCLQRASTQALVKRGALEDYQGNVRMLTEMNLTGRTGAAKFIHMTLLIWDSAKRLEAK